MGSDSLEHIEFQLSDWRLGIIRDKSASNSSEQLKVPLQWVCCCSIKKTTVTSNQYSKWLR